MKFFSSSQGNREVITFFRETVMFYIKKKKKERKRESCTLSFFLLKIGNARLILSFDYPLLLGSLILSSTTYIFVIKSHLLRFYPFYLKCHFRVQRVWCTFGAIKCILSCDLFSERQSDMPYCSKERSIVQQSFRGMNYKSREKRRLFDFAGER